MPPARVGPDRQWALHVSKGRKVKGEVGGGEGWRVRRTELRSLRVTGVANRRVDTRVRGSMARSSEALGTGCWNWN